MVGKTNAKGAGGSPQLYETYGVAIDFNATNPSTMCTYTDDAVGMTAGDAAWKATPLYSLLKTCILINGAVSAYLNEDDLSLLAGGGASDITTLGNDVMLEIGGRIGYMITWDSYRILKVKVTNNPNNPEYNYDAFSLDAYNDCNKIYIGVFEAYCASNLMYSSSGKTVTTLQNIDTFRTWARARGTGYQQRTHGSIKLMQCLYLIYFKTLNSQSAIGMGYVLSTHTSGLTTGAANAYGFNCEVIKASNPTYMTDQNHQVKCFGIEGAWGDYNEFVDGALASSTREILTCTLAKDFITDGTGYINNGNGGATANIANYMSRPQGGSNAGFIAQASGGSDSTYFCDYGYLTASGICTANGTWNIGSNAGIFFEALNAPSSFASATTGARLMYLHKEV